MDDHRDRMHEYVRLDIMNGHTLVFDVRRIFESEYFPVSPLVVVVHPQLSAIHYCTFSPSPPHTSVNGDTDYLQVQRYDMGGVLN